MLVREVTILYPESTERGQKPQLSEGGDVTHIVTYMWHISVMDLPSTTVSPLARTIHILLTYKIHMCLFQNPQTLIPLSDRFNLKTQDLTEICALSGEAAQLSDLVCM